MYILFGFIVILFVLLLGEPGGDSAFSIIESQKTLSENSFLYVWQNDIFGHVSILEKLRSFSRFLLEILGLYKFHIYILFFYLIGYFGTYYALKGFFSNYRTKYNNYIFIIGALFYVINPFSVSDYSHHYIVQGYMLTPIIGYLYYKYITNEKYINNYIPLYLFLILLLGQPHNYYNIFVVFVGISLLLFISGKEKFLNILKKNIVLGLLSIFVLFHVFLSFFVTIPNDLTSSVEGFSGSEPNRIWSGNQGIINSLLFKKGLFEGYLFLEIIYIFIVGYFIFSIYFIAKKNISQNENKVFNILIVFWIILLSLSFIAKNPFFNNTELRHLIYSFMPHIRVDITYILLIFIFPTLFGIIYFILKSKNKKINSFLLFLLVFISFSLGIIKNRDITNDINYTEVNRFVDWYKKNTQSNFTHNTLIIPPSVTYKFPGISQNIYPSLIIKNPYILHWNFVELTQSQTRRFLGQNIGNIFDHKKVGLNSIKYVVCFQNKNFNCFNEAKILTFIDSYDNIYLFKVKDELPILFSNNIKFNQKNVVNFDFNINNLTKQTLTFFESYHIGWNIYIQPYFNINCKIPEIYSGKILKKYSITECKSDKKFYNGGEISKLWQKPIFEDTHKVAYNYANSWTIDSDYIKNNFSKEYYKENHDGSIDVKLTLYFKPQSYFYLGLLISGFTFIILLSYLGFDFYRNRKNLKNK